MQAMDHIVIVSENPKADALEYGKQFGIEVRPGGKHMEWGTYNYLADLQNDCYIEWIGVFDEELAGESDNPLIQQVMNRVKVKEYGNLTYALRTENMDELQAHFDGNSIPYAGPFPGSRKKEDGSTISWRMLFPAEKENMPFFIEWGK